MAKNINTVKPLRKDRGRKIYAYGDRICLDVAKYVDQLTLDWINSQPSIATKIWEILIKSAHNDFGQVKSINIVKALGLENIEKLTELLNASPNTTKNSRELKNLKEETPKANKTIETLSTTGELNGINEKNNDKAEIKTKKNISEQEDKNSGEEKLIISATEHITEKGEELNNDNVGMYRKDGHMNLKEIVNKTPGGRRGLSRNTERSQLNSDKPNRMEMEMFGEKTKETE